jgi:hypothetical protein
MAVAVIALVVALGGTAAASFGPFKGDKIVKNRSLSGIRLKKHTITATEIRDGSLLAKNFKSGQLPAGPPGAPGQRGPAGSPAASMLTASTQTGALGPLGQSGSFILPPSGVATFSFSGIQLSPAAPAVARDLAVEVDNAPPGSAVLRWTLSVNGSATALSCTVQAGTRTCQDTTHVVAIPPAAEITFTVDNPGSGNSGTTGARWAWRATTP